MCTQGAYSEVGTLVPQWETADTEIKVPSVENSELQDLPIKAWSGSV